MDISEQLPDLNCKRDVILCNVSDIETGALRRCTFGFFDEQDSAWFGQIASRGKRDVSSEDIRQTLLKVPDSTVYPLVTPHITTIS
nr:hypothetical protein CFP56_31712 [Quercus suber]